MGRSRKCMVEQEELSILNGVRGLTSLFKLVTEDRRTTNFSVISEGKRVFVHGIIVENTCNMSLR